MGVFLQTASDLVKHLLRLLLSNIMKGGTRMFLFSARKNYVKTG